MSPAKGRRRPCSAAEADTRTRQAEAFLTTAELVRDEPHRPGAYPYNHVKDESHYGTKLLGADQVRRVMRAAEKLVAAANEVNRR